MLKPEQTPRRPAFLGDLFESLTERGRRLLGWREDAGPEAIPAPDLAELFARNLQEDLLTSATLAQRRWQG